MRLATSQFCGSLLLDNGILFNRKEKVHFEFAENNVESVTRRAATFVQYRCPTFVFQTWHGRGGHLGHVTSIMSSDFHFLVPENFPTKFGSDKYRSF